MHKCTLRIIGPAGAEERRAVFFGEVPSPGKTLTLEGREITITGMGFLGGRNLVLASARS